MFQNSTYLLLLTLLATPLAYADRCSLVVNSDDAMRFDTQRIVVSKDCETFTIHLKHTGRLAANIMGHNVVISKSSDALLISRQGRGFQNNGFIKPNDERVIAATDMIGGGEESSLSFAVSVLKADEKYAFFCSFPGHIGLMVGSLVVE
ncbi:MAG: azurin [Pseudomonadota bacterium]